MITRNEHGAAFARSENETKVISDFMDLYQNTPIPEGEILDNLGLFLRRQSLSRVLVMNELYKMIINTHGVVMEFGVRWGQNLALFQSFRGMYEPFNHNRKIIGFDTFSGFPSTHEKDGTSALVEKGGYSVTDEYEAYLEKVMDFHESQSPIPHIKKYELVKGDAVVEAEKYFKDHPETIVAFAYFDFDLYEPTKKCLDILKNHITKGTVIGFDELNDPLLPGETVALKESLGLDKYEIKRFPLTPNISYIVID